MGSKLITGDMVSNRDFDQLETAVMEALALFKELKQ
jgi:hypothetical protein